MSIIRRARTWLVAFEARRALCVTRILVGCDVCREVRHERTHKVSLQLNEGTPREACALVSCACAPRRGARVRCWVRGREPSLVTF